MTHLDDDLRTMFRRQADAMDVPQPNLDHRPVRLTTAQQRPPQRWLWAAAAAILLVAGLAVLVQRGQPATDSAPPAAPPASPTASPVSPAAPMFVFQTPTVRLTAGTIEVIAEGRRPGNAEYTTLELTWVEDAIEQRLFVYFGSDGTSWWAEEIRTRDGTADAEWVTAQGEWFRSPLGTPWVGDLDLPNLRITNMALEAFRRPDACTNPTAAIAVVPAYSSIDGVAIDGAGFAFHVDLIDTSNCTLVDPTPYHFFASVDDTSVAALVGQDSTPPTTSVEGVAGVPTSTPGRIELAMVGPGETTLRVTVSDSSGNEVGTVAVPVRVQASAPIATPTTVMWPPADS